MTNAGALPPDAGLLPGQATFYDAAIPPLEAGEYQIAVRHTVTVDGEPPAEYGAAQRFRVAGPHLRLAPTDVVAKRPSPGASGSYDAWLPHVVLAERTLPWQIGILAPPAAGARPPWLALLLLTRAEIDVGGSEPVQTSTGLQTVPVESYLNPPPNTSKPEVTDLPPNDTCDVVDVHFEAFQAVAPTVNELPWLAHVRQVGVGDQEELDVPSPGWYSVVVGNRLPVGAEDDIYIAHLVSLEGYASLLPDPNNPTPKNPPAMMRLLSLASWSFTSTPEAGDFAALMKDLDDKRPFVVPITPTGDPAGQQVAAAVKQGYTALRYKTRLGEETTGWYRGPLQPIHLATNPQPPFPVPASGLIYESATGMFDASYAAAYELGRLLTLANAPVTGALLELALGAADAMRMLLERAAPGGRLARTVAPDVLSPHAASSKARSLIAERVIPTLIGRRGYQPLGPRTDPTGLGEVSLPGLIDKTTLEELEDEAGNALVPAMRERALERATLDPLSEPDQTSDRTRMAVARATPSRNLREEGHVKARAPRARPDALRALARSSRARAIVVNAAQPLPMVLTEWLRALQRLVAVPFEYLVPNWELLPAESVRFFVIDQNWTNALVDGALSIAASSAATAAAIEMLREELIAATAPDVYSGMLMRSAAVSDWPGLRVSGFAGQEPTAPPLETIRFERVAPTILLVIFAGLVQRVEVSEPPQHLHFGVGSVGTPETPQRWIDGGRAGQPVSKEDPQTAVHERPDTHGRFVVNVGQLAADVKAALTSAYAGHPPNVGSAALAIQLLFGSQSQSFSATVTVDPSASPTGSEGR